MKMYNRTRAEIAGVLALVMCTAGHAQTWSSSRVAVDIAAQPLDKALHVWANQTDYQILFPSDESLSNQLAPSVKGQYRPEEALAALLSSSNADWEFLDRRTVAIRTAQRTDSRPAGSLRLAQAGTRDARATADASDKRNGIAEVVVTATKRSERLQDVPMSIAAVTADDIDRRGFVSSDDYLRGIPGVNQSSEQYGQSIVIRGIESSPSFQNATSGTTVATYFGETATTNSAGLTGASSIDIKLVDVERVEVLRGPQGTAFGNSSLGGAVRTIPVEPKTDRFEGNVAASYSVTSGSGDDNRMIQAVGNVPLISDRLAVRAVAYKFDESGFYRNRAGSDTTFRAAMAPYGVDAFAVDQDNVGAGQFTGGRASVLFQATDALKFTLSYLTQTTETDGFALATAGTFDQAILQVAPEHVRRGQTDGLFDTKIHLTNATMSYALPWADVLATYSYLTSDAEWVQSVTSSNLLLPISGRGVGDHAAHSGEVRMATKLDGPWNFLLGFYAEDLNDNRSVDYIWQGTAASNFFPGGQRFLGTSLDWRGLKQKAGFAEVSWQFAPRFTLTGGVRRYDYDREDNNLSSGDVFGNSTTALKTDASGSIYRGNLSFKATEDALLYAAWSQGFRLGTPQSGLPPGLCDRNGDGVVDGTTGTTIEQTKHVESDNVDNYEIGAKFSLMDRRLLVDADVFRLDWSGLPVLVYAPLQPTGCGQTYNANAGGARSEGAEMQVRYYVTDAFRVDAGGSYVRARLSKDAPALTPPAFRDDRLPGAPRLNANLGLQYDFNIAGYQAFVRADSIYVGSFYGNFQDDPSTRSGDYVKVDASARMTIKKMNIDLFVRNLTNADDFTYRGTQSGLGDYFGYRMRPRTVGVQLGYNFE